MPTTAFSAHFSRELDVEQLGWLLTEAQSPSDQRILPDLSRWAEWIRTDIRCPSCGKGGAQIVRPAKARDTQALIRQTHFRFVDHNGGDAHHPFCEFYGDSGTSHQADNLLNFGSPKSTETRTVRILVCKGIEQRLFDQATIREMRQWFFDTKVASRFTVTASVQSIDWARALRYHSPYHRWQFHPAQADMPAFDWNAARKFQFTEENLHLLELARPITSDETSWKRARALAERYLGHEVFDVTALQMHYEMTISLCTFVAKNSKADFGKTRPDYYRFQGAPTHLLALCALVLFTSNWEMNSAIGTFAKLLNAPAPTDLSLGNVMGLNPFHDYVAWRQVIVAAELATKSPNGLDYRAQLEAIEVKLREQYRTWKGQIS